MKKVLLIDDNKLIGKVTTQFLLKHGYTVEFVDSPFCVLNKVREFEPQLILLDINMPGIRGDRVARLLKDNVARLKPFIVILFSSEDEALQKGLVEQSLASAYFLKTGSLDGLPELLGSFVEPAHA